MNENETTHCRICGKQTPMLSTKLCDSCWELERRIQDTPYLALEILTKLNKTPLPPRRTATKIEIEAVTAICHLQDELEEARKVIRGLLTNLSPYAREQAIKFLRQHKSELQEKE